MSTTRIPINNIDPIQPSRKLHKDVVEKIAESVKEFGLFQAIGVVPHGDRYRLVWGNHRLQACVSAGLNEIEANILPPDTTSVQEIEFSLKENHLRVGEDFESTLARVEALAASKNCSFAVAAGMVGVSPSYVSKCQSAVKRLSPKAKKLAKEKGVGLSVVYPVSKAETEEAQLRLLNQYLAGSINRDGIEQAMKALRDKAPRARKVRIHLTIDGIGARITMPSTVDYETISMFLATLRNRFNVHNKQNIPVHLLPEVMK